MLLGSFIMLPAMALATYQPSYPQDNNFTPRTELLNKNASFFQSGSWILTAGSGAAFISNHQNAAINNTTGFPTPYGQDIYTTNNNTSTAGLLILAGGYQWQHASNWLPHMIIQLKYTRMSNVTFGGQVLKLSIPTANNFIYHYDLQTQSVLLDLKADLTTWHHFMPYLSFGAGPTINHMSNYTEHSNPPYPYVRTSPGFANKTTTNFTYQVGAGIDYDLNQKLIVSMGYVYQNLGDVKTGSGTGPTYTGQSLKKTAQSQLVEITMSYLL